MKASITIFLILISCVSYGQGNGLYKFLSENGKYGFIDKTGKIKIEAKYLIVGDFSEGLCYVSKEVIQKGYKWIFIDTLGNKAFDIQNNFPKKEFNEGFALISNFDEYWFINKKGINEFNKTWKDVHGGFKNGIAYVSDKKFSDFYPINSYGERIDDKTYSRIDIHSFIKDDTKKFEKNKTKFISDSFVPFKRKGLWGFKDNQNNIVIEPRFYKVDKFENGICAVVVNKREFEFANDYFMDAIIDENGKILNEINMHCYMGFKGDLIQYYGGIHFSGGIYYLNDKGEKIIPHE